MPQDWREAYTELRDYISRHPDIKMTASSIALPAEVRPGFYRLFDLVRLDMVRCVLGAELELADELSQHYLAAEGDLKARLGLNAVTMSQDTRWFLENPGDGLMRTLFDPLFELARGLIDQAAFERMSRQALKTAFERFFEESYRRWVMLSLTLLLQPEQLYHAPIKDERTDGIMQDVSLHRGMSEGEVPEAAEVKDIDFAYHGERLNFITPQILVSSGRLGCYGAVHSDSPWAMQRASNASVAREWHSLQHISHLLDYRALWPDIVLYADASLEDLALITDCGRILRPDVAVEVMEDADWLASGSLEGVRRHHSALKPRFGTYVVCRAKAAAPAESGIHLLDAGFDKAGLEPVLAALAGACPA